jgi:hypothetical protein
LLSYFQATNRKTLKRSLSMKKTILIFTSFLLVSTNGNTNADSSNGDASNPGFDLPLGTKLILGTVKLDETDYAVDADQASQLLPLWKALRSLGESDTAAQAEIDAVISQIEDTMTSEQMKAIEAMGLTMQDFASVAQTLGIETGFGAGSFGEVNPEMRATAQAMRESGDFPAPPDGAIIVGPGGDGTGGGFGPGGGQGFGGQDLSPEARQTAIAERSGTRGASLGMNTALLDAIIEFLTAKTQ